MPAIKTGFMAFGFEVALARVWVGVGRNEEL
jgi:hypothetical protein